MGLVPWRERRKARADEWRRADLAEAARLGAEFGLGTDAQVARVRVPQTPRWLELTLMLLLWPGVTMGFPVEVVALVMSAWPGNLILGVLTPAAGVALWLLARYARSLVVWHRIYRYPDGIIQLVSGEPEPRVLRWAAVDSVRLVFYDPTDGPFLLLSCQLEGAGTTVDAGGASGLQYPTGVIRDVARDAERNLAPRIAGSLISRFDAGEPVIAGHWRIDQAGVTTNHHKPGKSRLIPWTDIREIIVSNNNARGNADPPDKICLRPRRAWALERVLFLAYIPNGMFLPHLFDHIAAQHALPLLKGSWPGHAGPQP